MGEWVRSALDILLILMVGAGLVQAARLITQLAGLRQGRIEMERFVQDFNATVLRAEAGIKGLKMAARESGDDLEKLVEKANRVRDELQFITESADQLADRLSQSASAVMRNEVKQANESARPVKPVAVSPKAEVDTGPVPSSRAEKELLSALKKLS